MAWYAASARVRPFLHMLPRHHAQVIIYNHALLSLWTEDVWLAVTDLDESLMTPRPMSSLGQVG